MEYPNGDVVRWKYEPKRDLLTLVSNATHSTYCYTYDIAGRRVSKNDELYGYNVRNELILATNILTGTEFAYCYDDIGNRLWSREFGTNTTYTVNSLNQYTNIVRSGIAQYSVFDADGNQTDVTTGSGRWIVEYNGENRPVMWTRHADGTVIEMSYDHKGRRVCSSTDTFVYDKYLNIGYSIWDPTEPVATRPLLRRAGLSQVYYFHDENKNVVDVIGNNSLHYDYAPFGMIINFVNDNDNPWCFSSEFNDAHLELVYYNYRKYSCLHGRWMTRDPMLSWMDVSNFNSGRISDEDNLKWFPLLSYGFLRNAPTQSADYLGLLDVICTCIEAPAPIGTGIGPAIGGRKCNMMSQLEILTFDRQFPCMAAKRFDYVDAVECFCAGRVCSTRVSYMCVDGGFKLFQWLVISSEVSGCGSK